MAGNRKGKYSNPVWNKAVVALLLVSILASLMPNAVAKRKTSGTFEGTKWSYNTKTKTLTLSCKGKMDDESVNMYGAAWPWTVWRGEMERVIIKEGVTYIGMNALEGCNKLKDVSLPKSLKEIGIDAFSDTSISEISLPPKLEKINPWAFSGSKLKKISIPNNVSTLGWSIFNGCKKLKNVTLASNQEMINSGFFYQCIKLKNITIPSNIIQIKERAFKESGLTTITIPKKVTRIKAEAFKKCTSLKKVTFKTNKLTSIDASLFEDCKKLTAITIPDSVTKIKKQAFKGSGLTVITIPGQVTTIEEEAFANCNGLKEVIFSGSQVTSIKSNAFLNLPADCVFKVPTGQAETVKAQLIASGLADSITVTEY